MAWANDERETILRFDYMDQMWYAWTNVPAHITKFQKQHWEMVRCNKDGSRVIDAEFCASKPYITIGDTKRAKRKGNVAKQEDDDD